MLKLVLVLPAVTSGRVPAMAERSSREIHHPDWSQLLLAFLPEQGEASGQLRDAEHVLVNILNFKDTTPEDAKMSCLRPGRDGQLYW